MAATGGLVPPGWQGTTAEDGQLLEIAKLEKTGDGLGYFSDRAHETTEDPQQRKASSQQRQEDAGFAVYNDR